MKKMILAVAVIAMALAGCGEARVRGARFEGEALLAQAESEKKVGVETAKAKLDAAEFEAKAEIVRAQGVAEANRIIANGLGGPEGYLRWKYIEMLENNKTATTIYIPTEAGLPILEARNK